MLPERRNDSDARPRPGRTALVFLAVLAALVAGCDRTVKGVEAHEPPRYGGTAVVAGPSDLSAMNPLVSSEAWADEVLRFALFMPLIRYDAKLGYEPYLAQSWEMTGDTGVVFHLRHDVRWQDGQPTTAYDVAFTYERAQDPATGFPNTEYFEYWHGVQVLDSFTVRFTFEPHAEPLAGLPFTPIAPKHLLDTIPPDRMRRAAFNLAPVGNGPFRYVSHRANDRWVFEANPDFPEALGGRPYLDRFVWRVVPDNTAQLAELQAGDVDVALSPPMDAVRSAAAAAHVRLVQHPSRRYAFVGWNGLRPPLNDPRVRRALTMAIDRQAMVDAFRNGLGQVAVGPVMPWHWAFDHDLPPLPFDPDSARALLAAAGYQDRDGDGVVENAAGQPFRIELKVVANNATNMNIAEVIRANLAAVGVQVTTRPVEATTLISDVTSPDRNFDAFEFGWDGDFRLNLRNQFHSAEIGGPYQFASYRNPVVDSILDEANRITHRAQALPLWYRLQRILRDQQPWTFLYYQPQVFLVRDRLHDASMDIRGALVNLPKWWVSDGQE
ncbi:MAG TPA: ABC transporter substrate-binding protein [Longimicrobiales bacterium]|nr:ABC transporter substrate-binding protein [Longimicrobiales bacterium]